MAEAEPDAWAGPRVDRWLHLADGLERQLAPVAEVLARTAALQPGERVLDVGCGVGPTTREAANAVGPAGSVTGIDVSAEMLAAAAERPLPAESATITWVTADATSWDAPDDSFDVVISRFGVMFFADPQKAFTNLARVAAPGGRLHVAVWADRTRCDLFEVPLAAVLDHRRRAGLPAVAELPPDAGPFSLSDPEAVRAMLCASGWRDPLVEHHRLALRVGGGLDAEAAARSTLDLGPARAASADLTDAERAAASAAVTAAFRDHVQDDEVVLHGEILVVSAYR